MAGNCQCQFSVNCDSQSGLEPAVPRPANWLYTILHTYASYDWIRPENLVELTQPRVTNDTNLSLFEEKIYRFS